VAASVSLAAFESVVQPVKDYRSLSAGGGTRTDLALAWADRALEGKDGRRVCIVITDGQPNSTSDTQAACQQLRSHGVNVIGVAYQCGSGGIFDCLPGSKVVAANDPNTLAVQLSRIASEVASSAA
jgi:Mg-chelatase subunit ChlD